MAAGNKILGFAVRIANEAGDALDDVVDDLDDVADKAADAAKEVGGFGTKLFATAEAGGNAEQALRGTSDILGFMGDQFGVQVGPIGDWSAALADAGGGVEAVLKGGPALVGQLKALPASLGPVIAGTWAHVAALTAQAAAFIIANAPILLLIGGIALLVGGIVLLVKNWDTITEKVPILGTAVDKVKDVVIGAKDLLLGALNAVPSWLRDHWPEVAVLISGPFAPIVLLATDAFGVRSALVGAFEGALQSIKELAGTAWTAAKNVGDGIKDGIVDGIKGIAGSVVEIASSIQDALKAAVNTALRWAHDTITISIPGFDPPGPGSIPGFDWKFPLVQLATGGVVTRPTLALIGEAGPEAVVPLSGPNATSFGANITVVVQALDGPSVREWLRAGGAEMIADEVGRRAAFA